MEEQPPEHYSRSEVENVKVAVRCRPLSGLERQQGHRQIVQIDGQTRAILIANPHSPNEPEKHYAFDAIFGPDSSQSYVYNSIARPIVDNVLKGFNGTIFAYGQTGTGKTFTMSGDPDSNENGIIQFSFAQIFDHIVKSGHEKRFLVRISYMEIYNEEVRDLLARHSNSTSTTSQSQPRSLEIKERQDIGVYVKDLLNVTVSNADQCMRIMHFGNSNRHTGKTAMNEQSSRSHAIFTITIECSETFVDGRQLLTQGKLSFVDLAGSERQSKTNAVGEQLREATKINLSLSTLGNVISVLAEAKSQHIPYRNSKLTRILQDSLGGNSKTCMIANIGPASYNYEETVSTLRYASRAKRIQNVARINEDPKDALLRRFQEEIEQLKRALEDVEPESDAENKSDDEKHCIVMSATGEAHKQQENLKATKKEGNVDAHDASASNNQNAAERRRLAEDLLRRNEELKRNKLEREKLTQKLMTIERQIIVGGENMLEKAELQAQLLDESNQDLEQARQNEQTLHERFRNQQAEHLDIEERNSSMQEQAQGLGKKLKKVWVQYMQTKQELHDQEMEHNRETETLLETIRQLERELTFSSLVIDQFVPVKQQRFIERHTHWNEEIGDWQLRCIAYTGNNIREDHRLYNPHYKATDPQLMPLFLNYADFMEPSMGNNSSHPDSASSSTSSHTSKARIKEAARIQALLE